MHTTDRSTPLTLASLLLLRTNCTSPAFRPQTKLQLDGAKASDYLRRFLLGDPSIKLPRLSFAMQHMYNTDQDFQAAVNRCV